MAAQPPPCDSARHDVEPPRLALVTALAALPLGLLSGFVAASPASATEAIADLQVTTSLSGPSGAPDHAHITWTPVAGMDTYRVVAYQSQAAAQAAAGGAQERAREGSAVLHAEALCEVLDCQPGDLLRWEPADATDRARTGEVSG